MHRRPSSLLHATAIAVAALLVACATTPSPRFHTLMRAEPSVRAPSAQGVSVAAVLEPIRLPAQVDQPQFLVRLSDDTVAVLEQERWASPLRDELREALRDELITAWGMTEERPAPGARAPMRIGLDVRRFDSVIGVEARIAGSWTLLTGDARAAAASCEWFVRERAPGGITALAAAHRLAVLRLAAGIGENLDRVSRGGAVRCPVMEPGA